MAELSLAEALASIEPIDTSAELSSTHVPIGQLIADRVRDAILDGRLPPATRVPQEALAHRFGVSRIPVREALRHLESEGLLTLVPHSGARVSHLDLGEHIETYTMREALEPLAIAASAPLLSDEQLQVLHQLLEEVEANADTPSRWLAADRRFHLATYAAAPMPRLLAMIEQFWNTTQHYRRVFLEAIDPDTLALVHWEHRLLLDALQRRDYQDAEFRLRSHLRRTRQTLSDREDLFP